MEQHEIENAKNPFCSDLCTAMVSANIPFKTLNNSQWKAFLSKYCVGQHIPDESTIRKNYLGDTYAVVIELIKEEIGDDYYWISVDETTDRQGRMMANMIIGSLSEQAASKPRLVACRQLEKANSDTVAKFVNNTLRSLWPHGNEDKLLLFLSDAAPYMVKAGSALKVFYGNIDHVTCLAHGFHRVCEEIRKLFPQVRKYLENYFITL